MSKLSLLTFLEKREEGEKEGKNCSSSYDWKNNKCHRLKRYNYHYSEFFTLKDIIFLFPLLREGIYIE